MITATPDKVIELTSIITISDGTRYLQLVAMLAIVIFLKHIEPLQQLMKDKKLLND
jgi:hypothetical protein